MAGAECYRTNTAGIRHVSHHRLCALTQKQAAHRELLVCNIGYLNPRVRASRLAALVVTCCDAHLIDPRRQLRGIREHDVVAIGLGLFESWCRGYDPVHETIFDRALLIEIDGTQIDDGLNLPVRLFTKDEKLTRNVNRSRKRWPFARHVVIVSTQENGQSALWIWRRDCLSEFCRSGFGWCWLLFCNHRRRCGIEIEVTFSHSHRKIRTPDHFDLEISETASLLRFGIGLPRQEVIS